MNTVDLALEAVDRAVHDGDVVEHGGVVDEIARREVVGAVDDHVPAVGEDAVDVLGGEALLVGHDLDVGVQRLDRALRRVGLPLAERLGRVRDLALQVRRVDAVVVDDAEPADAGGCEIEGGGGAEAAGADEQHARVEQLELTFVADLGNQQVPAVARPLLGVEHARQLRREAVALPVGVAAGERDDVLVAELLERLRGERGAVAGLAVEDDRLRAVGGGALDARLEVPARHVDRAGEVAFAPLVRLADVDEERRLGGVEELAGAHGVHLLDLGLDLLQQLAVGRHDFQKYSGLPAGYAGAR